MNIKTRILIINFVTVFVVIIGITIAFYSIMINTLTDNNTQNLLKNTNKFVYLYQKNLDNAEIEINNFIELQNKNIELQHVDFILKKSRGNSNLYSFEYFNNNITTSKKKITLDKFVFDNPFLSLEKYISTNGDEYIYGKRFTQTYINNLSKQTGSDIALIWNNFPSVVSTLGNNNNDLFGLSEISKELEKQSNFSLLDYTMGSVKLIATNYNPDNNFKDEASYSFLIFSSVTGLSKFWDNLRLIILLTSITGVLLSIILTLIFSNRIRRQLNILGEVAVKTGEGQFKNKIEINSNDEIGKLANAFNNMLTDLEKSERAKKEYSDFIELVNQNPTLNEFSEAILKKIITAGNFPIGALYSVTENEITLCGSYGVSEEELPNKNLSYLQSVVKSKETKELTLKEDSLTISLGIVSVKLKQLLIIPVVYNNVVIGILELGLEDLVTDEIKNYLNSIKLQLAIGLSNAKSFLQLEKMVSELKQLNIEFQKQNVQITGQNKSLKELHDQLKTKADELEIQKAKAEEATKLKSQFLASMSHELRTPMNAILGLTELILEDDTLDTKDRERLKVVLKSGKRLMMLINDVLDLSKIEAGKMDIHLDTLVLNDLISEVEANIKPLVADKNILFKVTKKTNTNIIIRTDGYKITQVLINLIGNAVKFTNEGFVELSINLLPKDNLEFKIIDTGIGISEEDIKIIFEEFRQADGSTTRKHSGTGLGLSISSKIAKLLNGKLQVFSEIEKGSSFTFTLPIEIIDVVKEEEIKKDDQEKPKNEVKAIEEIKNENKPLVQNETRKIKGTVKVKKAEDDNSPLIMIVDDDADTLFTINELVESLNYQTVLAKDGLECIKKLEEIIPDLILLDIMMPRMDGFQALTKIRENKMTKDITVLAVTARAMEEDKKIIIKHGFDGHISKPVDPLILTNNLKSVFNKIKQTHNA